jgi:NAD(P)-dependent dehydrogenase (short-subunit alcohol dehydrogenase family)
MNILISGASRGIGKEIALQLAKNRDNRIIIISRNAKALKELVRSSGSKNISYFVLDLARLNLQQESFIKEVTSIFDHLDILINNAGSLFSRNFADSEENDIRTMMETNFFAPASLIRILLPLFRRGSHIVNISSMGGFQGSEKFPGLSYYSASKAALACLSECLAMEFREAGISVNCLALGSVSTEMLEEAFPGYKAPVSAADMGEFIASFALNGHKYFNGKILPITLSTP